MEKTGREGQEGDNEVVEGRYKIKKGFLSFFFFLKIAKTEPCANTD